MKYRPEVDGLRAVAILPVVLYHAGLPAFSGGFVGVDVFFVISGYLIGSIILGEMREGTFTLTGFYQRRIRRIFPALFVMLAVTYPVAWALLGPGGMREFAGSFAAAAASVANVYFLGVSGYFATAAELKPLLHSWSLSVEEQFYLVFPGLLLLTQRLGTRLQMALLALAALASLGIAQWWIVSDEAASAFFLLQARFWELLAGVFAAYWLATPSGQDLLHGGRVRHLALLGLALIAAAVFGFDGETPFPGLAALLPCVGAALVILFAKPGSAAGRLLSWGPFVFIGLISYSLYLWHYPLLAFTRIAGGGQSTALLLAACLLSGLLAVLSWRYVERPVRRLPPQPPRRLFGWAASGLAALLLLGLAGFSTDGYRSLYVAYRMDPATRQNYELHQPLANGLAVQDQDCSFSPQKVDAAFEARLGDCARRFGKGMLLLGDSHAANIYNALRAGGQQPFLVLLWHSGCRPFRPKSECPYEDAVTLVKRHAAAFSDVVFHISGSHLIHDQLGREDKADAFLEGNHAELALADAAATADYVSRLDYGPRVTWLGPFAEARIDLQLPENFSPGRLHINPVSLDLFARLDSVLKQVSAGKPYRYVSLVDALNFGAQPLRSGDCILFSDQDHLSPCGEKLLAPKIAAALR